jgi:hypothetical protein
MINKKYIYRPISVTISTASIIVLLVDFFYTKDFMSEDSFVIFCVLALLCNILRVSIPQLRSYLFLKIITNVTILGLSLYCSWVLSILSFGFGYTGKEISVNMNLAFVLNIAFYFVLILDVGEFKVNKKAQQGV